MVGGIDKGGGVDKDARDRISAANVDNAAHFIWFELSKELKADWNVQMIRSVLDICPRFAH
jgi:hypothetical protein